MDVIPSALMSWADFLAKLGQFAFGLAAMLLAMYAAYYKRVELFRTELQKRQFDEVASIRGKLHEIFFDAGYLPLIKGSMEVMSWNFDDLKREDPDSWQQYQRYKANSVDVFYKVGNPKYYLWPRWIDRRRLQGFSSKMENFAPFTLVSTASPPKEELRDYINEVVSLMHYLDEQLGKHA